MDTEIDLYQILAESFLKAGYTIHKDVNRVLFQPLNLIIEVEISSADNSEGKSSSVVLNISCRHYKKIPKGISETALGLGDNYKKAVEQAFDNWIISDFTPIHDYLCNSDDLLGGYGEIVSYSDDLNEVIGWDLFFGPRLEATQNNNQLEIAENEKDQKQIQQILFQPMIDSLFGTPDLYYIRTFMSKINNSQINCDCRVNGNEWKHGKNYLVDYITRYHAGSGVFWIKQNILLVNKPADKIKSSHLVEDLNRELGRQRVSLTHPQKKWWDFWK